MEYSILKQLLNQVTYDVRELIPKEYFNPLSLLKGIPAEKSLHMAMNLGLSPNTTTDRIFASRASEVGKLILGRNELLNARQYAACMLFDSLGKYLIIESKKIDDIEELEIKLEPSLEYFTRASYVNYLEPIIVKEFYVMLKRYLDQVETQEAKPFISLLESDPEQSKPHDEGGRQIKQENEILNAIVSLGYDSQNLPPRPSGKPWVKAEVRKSFKIPGRTFQSKNVYDDAWQRLLDKGKIK